MHSQPPPLCLSFLKSYMVSVSHLSNLSSSFPIFHALCLSSLNSVFFFSMHSQSCVNLGLSLFSKGQVMDSFGFLEFCWFFLIYFTGKDATNDFEDVGHNDDAREMMEKYDNIGEVDVTTVPTKRLYVAPGLEGTNPKDKKPGFLIKICNYSCHSWSWAWLLLSEPTPRKSRGYDLSGSTLLRG